MWSQKSRRSESNELRPRNLITINADEKPAVSFWRTGDTSPVLNNMASYLDKYLFTRFYWILLFFNWTIFAGKSSEARDALKWLRGPEYDMEQELAEMEARVRIELSQKSRFSDLWSSWAWKPVMVAIGLMVFQQLSGINAALFNAVAIFESAGSELDTLVAAVLLNVDQVRYPDVTRVIIIILD